MAGRSRRGLALLAAALLGTAACASELGGSAGHGPHPRDVDPSAADGWGAPGDGASGADPAGANPADAAGDGGASDGADAADGGRSPHVLPFAAPRLEMTIAEGDVVTPQTTLHLSYAVKGVAFLQELPPGTPMPELAVRWSVQGPPDVPAAFAPSSLDAAPEIVLNGAGRWTICVTSVSWLPAALVLPTPTCAQVEVVPESKIHVELTWHTPGDAVQTDTGPAAGSDVDLHFAHPYAQGPDLDGDGAPDPWFVPVYDTFWYEKNPNWGGFLTVDDNPSLDLDDTDGAGPENINLLLPQGTSAKPVGYHVGVHYWHDHGFGDSAATVRVWLDGELAAVAGPVRLHGTDLWHVGRIWWPHPPGVPDSARPGVRLCARPDSQPTSTQKVWQSSLAGRVPCVTPCYHRPGFHGVQSGLVSAGCVP